MIKIMIIYITSYISIDWLLWQDFRCINTAFSFVVDCSQSIYWRKKWSKLWLKWKSNFFIMVLTIANPHHDQPGSLLIPLNSPPGTSQHCSQGRLGSGIPHISKSIVTDWVQTYRIYLIMKFIIIMVITIATSLPCILLGINLKLDHLQKERTPKYFQYEMIDISKIFWICHHYDINYSHHQHPHWH